MPSSWLGYGSFKQKHNSITNAFCWLGYESFKQKKYKYNSSTYAFCWLGYGSFKIQYNHTLIPSGWVMEVLSPCMITHTKKNFEKKIFFLNKRIIYIM